LWRRAHCLPASLGTQRVLSKSGNPTTIWAGIKKLGKEWAKSLKEGFRTRIRRKALGCVSPPTPLQRLSSLRLDTICFSFS